MASIAPISGILGLERAAHLLRRATYGCTREEIEQFATLDIDTALNQLFDFPNEPPPPVDVNSGNVWASDGDILSDKRQIYSWFIYEILRPGVPPNTYYKLVFFLHTCLTVIASDAKLNQTNLYYHLKLLMMYADKSYKDLARKMTKDSAMGGFLDIASNKVGQPNENYGRELLELFTVGKGPQIGPGNYTNYTEGDIQEASRVLTGFVRNHSNEDERYFDPDTNMPVLRHKTGDHDPGDKQFSAAFQNRVISGRSTIAGMEEEVDELIDMIFDQNAVSEFICRKIYRFFVHYNITADIEDNIIQPLAKTFRDNNYLFVPVLTQLFKSQHFYDEDDNEIGDHVIGAMIKNPADLWLGALRFFKAYIPDIDLDLEGTRRWMKDDLYRGMELLGIAYLNPPSVAGYVPMYQEPNFLQGWISSSTLPYRYREMVRKIHTQNSDNPLKYGYMDIMNYVEDASNIPVFNGDDPMGNPGPHEGARIASHLVKNLLDFAFPVAVDDNRFSYFLDDLLLNNLSETTWMFEWDDYKATGDDSNVRPQLEKLYAGIVQSPEFQLF